MIRPPRRWKSPPEIVSTFLLAHLIPPSAHPLPRTASRVIRCKTFGSKSPGLSSCVPVVAPLSCCPPGDRRGHTLEVHRGRARADRSFPCCQRIFFLLLSLTRSAGGWRRTVRPPVSRQGRSGACVSYGTLPETAREAHCCSAAPPLPELLYQCRSARGWEVVEEEGVSGVQSCDFTPSVR